MYAKIHPGQFVIQEYEIKPTLLQTLPTEENPCDDSNRDRDTNECIRGALQSKIGCRIVAMYGGSSSNGKLSQQMSLLPSCSTWTQLNQYWQQMKDLEILTEAELYQATGCHSTCTRWRYEPIFKGKQPMHFLYYQNKSLISQ